VRVIDTDTGCFDFAELILDVSLTNANDTILINCDDDSIEDGYYNFTLSNANADVLNGLLTNLTLNYYETYEEALLEQNPLGVTYTNTVPYSQTIYVRVENDNACYGINQIQLTVLELPNIESEFETIYCLNAYPKTITLDSGLINNLPPDFTYLWSTGETTQKIQVNSPGVFTVTITNNNGCLKLRTITVIPSNIATIESIEVADATSNNTITVLSSGEGEYEYALYISNGIYRSFQTENVFTNVSPGIYTLYVRDIKNDCGIIDDLVSVIGFPKFFTPNGDTYNDYWQIQGVSNQFQPDSKILIFDRYGKLLKQLNPQSLGWDGTFNGQDLPSSDYWFHVKLQDGRIFKSHFSLKR